MKSPKTRRRKKPIFYHEWLFKLPPGTYDLKTLVSHSKTSISSVVRALRNLGLQAEYVRNEETGYSKAVYTWEGEQSLSQ